MEKCPVTDCPKAIHRGGYCYAHYMKNWRYGTPTPNHPRRYEDVTGQRFGTLTPIKREGIFWICQCDCGETRRASMGELNRTGQNNTCGIPGKHLSEDVEYTAVHGRVRNLHGSARQHACVSCGEPALHWSYDHLDPEERISQAERTAGIAYSLKTEHYQARCVPCHKRYDLDRINATRLAA